MVHAGVFCLLSEPAPTDSCDTACIIGLAVGIPLGILLLIIIVVLVTVGIIYALKKITQKLETDLISHV